MKDIQNICNQVSSWIREKVLSANATGVVLGLSGGVDSAVVAALCKKAFPDNTLCLIMPCHSKAQDEEHARLVANKLNLKIEKIVLDDIYDLFRKQVNSSNFESKSLLGNIKSRLRMITLYYYAGKHNYLVVGPTNKSELTIGYFTKHGDSGVDIMPIADFVKQEIYELAKYLEIPEDIISKAPSAGLWDNQTDEDEMKMSYNQLDKYITMKQVEIDTENKIEGMIARSEHKRNFPHIYKRR